MPSIGISVNGRKRKLLMLLTLSPTVRTFFLNKPNLIGIVGQFGTGQFGNVNLAPRVKSGQFGTES